MAMKALIQSWVFLESTTLNCLQFSHLFFRSALLHFKMYFEGLYIGQPAVWDHKAGSHIGDHRGSPVATASTQDLLEVRRGS